MLASRPCGSVCGSLDTSETMSRLSRGQMRSQTRPQQASRSATSEPGADVQPERLLLDQIAAGALDPHLVAIADAVRARDQLLHTISSHKALAMLNVGDRVQINARISPQYLRGIHGVIVELDEHTVLVRMNRPIGRFKAGEIRCPPLALDRLNPAA